jgi:hypothetical protein
VLSIIRVRQYELDTLLEAVTADSDRSGLPPQQALRIARARGLVGERPRPGDRRSAHELLDRLDGIMPLIVDDVQLRLMLEAELDRPDALLGAAQRERVRQLVGKPSDTALTARARRQSEVLLTDAVRERNNRVREELIASELRQNYLTWLGTVLVVLLAAACIFAALTPRHGLRTDLLLALVAGALGGTLSGALRLRAPERRLTALKNLGLVLYVQPLLGAVGGLVVFAIWRAGLVEFSGLGGKDWASIMVVAFVGGFSEPFLLRTLEWIAGSADSRRQKREQPDDDRGS